MQSFNVKLRHNSRMCYWLRYFCLNRINVTYKPKHHVMYKPNQDLTGYASHVCNLFPTTLCTFYPPGCENLGVGPKYPQKTIAKLHIFCLFGSACVTKRGCLSKATGPKPVKSNLFIVLCT